MNIIITSSLFLLYCCVIITNASADNINPCSANIFPPDPKTRCCGVDTFVSDKIIGAPTVTIEMNPWLARIEYDRNGTLVYLSGGTLISSKYVLSTANALTSSVQKISKPINVILGDYDTRTEGPDCQDFGYKMVCIDGITRIPIEKIILHPEYNPSIRKSLSNDIALIRLERPAPFTDFIRPICLPSVDMTLRTEPFTLIKAGWGDVSGLSPVKLQVDLPYVNREDCQKIYSDHDIKVHGGKFILEKGQICAGGVAGKDSCPGDAGMPLVFGNGYTYEAIGLASFGFHPCGQANSPSVYTNLYEYKNWIISNIVA